MDKFLKISLFAFAFGVMASVLPAQVQQNPVQSEITFKAKPIEEVPKYKTINLAEAEDPWQTGFYHTLVMPAPGEEISAERMRSFKDSLYTEKVKARASGSNDSPANKTMADSPVLGTNFFGNTFNGIPNDNSMCISMAGKILSATNSKLVIYNSSGSVLATKTLASFFSNSTLVYDPRVTYDPEWGRFILVYLSSDAAANSRVVVCFSETSDPLGNWHVYPLIGNPDPSEYGNCWTDYPQIALTRKELIITGNLFYDSDQSAGVSYIWQISKADGYNGEATLTTQGWGAVGMNNHFSLTPCEGNTELYGPNIWFVSTPNSVFSSSTAVYLHQITDTIGGANPQFITYSLFSNTAYGLAPDADQMGTSVLLDTRGLRIRSAYYQNERIQFGMNATRQNKCQIYYGTISGLANPSFAAATAFYVNIDSFDIGYPALAYGGRQAADGTNSSLLFFNFSSPDHYPGNACVYIDTNGTVSAPTVNKYGFTYCDQMSTSPERWGDYAECAPKHDNPGEIWCAGYVGYNSSAHYHGTWISQIFLNGAAPIAVEPSAENNPAEMTVFPNPTADEFKIRFEIPVSRLYNVRIYDLDGQIVKTLLNDHLKAGEAVLSFQTGALTSGVYFVVVESEQGEILREKLVIQK